MPKTKSEKRSQLDKDSKTMMFYLEKVKKAMKKKKPTS